MEEFADPAGEGFQRKQLGWTSNGTIGQKPSPTSVTSRGLSNLPANVQLYLNYEKVIRVDYPLNKKAAISRSIEWQLKVK